MKIVYEKTKIGKASAIRPSWRLVVIASMIIGAGTIAFSQNTFPKPDSSQVIQFLNQTLDWYRHMAAVQQTAMEPDDLLVMTDNGRMADQIVRLAFDFANAQAAPAINQESSGQNQEQNAGSPQHTALSQLKAKLDQQTQETQAEVDSLRQKLEALIGKRRQELQARVEETQGHSRISRWAGRSFSLKGTIRMDITYYPFS
jgi:hypothetical protein